MQPPFQVKSLFPYESTYEDDLSFGSGVTITVTSVENDEWFSGEYDGKSGMFPKNFVEIIQAPVVPTLNRPVKRTTTQDLSTSDEPKPKPKPTEEPIVEPAESKPVESHSIPKPIESHSVPKPVSNIHKPVDPYSIKKQFVAASTSHYVPKVQPRDDYNLVVHPVHDTKEPDVRSNVDEQHKQEEDDAPKLTLKERIALIQKQQQEEAEREAAALKKKEERKKKQAAEKERLQQLKQSQPHVDTEPGIASHGTGETVESEDYVPVSPVDRHRHSLPTGHDERNLEGEEEDNEEEQEEDAEHNDKERGIVDEEDEPEEEDEDEKRRKLVERMAKFAGGRNLFGLPFGAPAPPTKAPTRSKEVEPPIPTSAPPPPQNEEEEEEEEDNEETPVVDKSIKLVKQNTTELEGTGYEADLSEASKVEGKREEEEDDEEDDDDEEEELIEKPHHHHHHHAPPPPPPPTTRDEPEETPRHAPPPPPPGTRDDDDDDQEVEHQHHHHHHHRHGSKAAPPPPPIPDQAPPIPGSISVPPLPSAPAPTSPVASSIPPPIPGSMPPIPGSAPPPPIPGTIPPPLVQPRYAEDEDGDEEEEEETKDEDNAGFESVENPPALPKRSGSEHKRRSFELPFTRSKSLKQPKEDIAKDLQRVIQKLDVRKHGQFKIQLELEVEDGKLLKYNVRS